MKHSSLFSWYFGLTGLEAAAAAVWLASLPAEAGSAFAFGFSLARLTMIASMIVLGLLNLAAVIRFARTGFGEKAVENRWVRVVMVVTAIISWALVFSPAYQWGRFAGYQTRLFPIVLWVLLASLQAAAVMLIRAHKTAPLLQILSGDRQLTKTWGLFLGILAVGVVVVAVFRVGFVPDIVYWNDVNVPLLAGQIMAVTVAALLAAGILTRFGFFADGRVEGFRRVLPDVILCLFIWGLAVTTWTQVSMPHSYFSPGPYPPNNEMYPFSDAASYDRDAQLAVIGEGIGTRYMQYVDKPLYVGFLAIIHLIVGNRMDAVTGAQVAVIALLPVLLYLMGRKLHSRLAGLMAAGFLIFRELNNIQGTLWVLSSNSRVLMSESLVTLLLALFVFMLLSWFKEPGKNLYLVGAGGSLGLAGLVRLNPFLLAPVAVIALLLFYGKNWKKGILSAGLFSLVFALALLPYMLHSYDRHDKFLFFQSTVQGVVLGQRTYYSLNTPAPSTLQEVQPTLPAEVKPVNKTWNRITGITRYVSAHFFHNMVDGAALFPTTLTFDSLEQTIRAPGSYWSAESDGNLSTGSFVLMLVSLGILALGAADGWTRSRWAGLIPAGFMLMYSLATAAARTSGGRYFLPADWVFLLYFAFGLSRLAQWGWTWLQAGRAEAVLLPVEVSGKAITPWWKAVLWTALFVLVGASPVILDRTISPRYTRLEKYEVKSLWSADWMLKSLEITDREWAGFISQPGSFVFRGRALYPRYYEQNKGEPDRFSAGRVQGFPRLVLEVIGPNGMERMVEGVLPLEKMPDSLPNGADVTVIGCRSEMNDELLVVIIEGQDGGILRRSPSTAWTCPVKLPVCDDNRECR